MEKCHFIGIGGIGMSGLARILLRKKIVVTGSDIASSYVTEGLKTAGAEVFIGHDAKYVNQNTTVVYNSDIKKDNPELLAAQQLNCRMLHRSDLLHYLMEGYKTLAVTGTHGKTTTSSLLTSVLINEGLDPSFAVGGIIAQLKANAGYGDGKFFIAEADESDGTFLKYRPYGAIITNIDLDHMNHFLTEEALIQAFRDFASQVESPQHLFWCGDDVRLQNLKLPGISYGTGSNCTLRALNIVQKGWTTIFDIEYKGRRYSQVKTSMIGHHNVLNALAVFGLALSVGAKEGSLRDSLVAFEGVGRRCEKKGEMHKIQLLDDYAHHPTEVKTTLEGIRAAIGDRRLVAVFQPHRYSRTKDCLGTYGTIFEAADTLIITDLFASNETPIPGVSHEPVLAEVKQHSSIPVQHIPRNQLADAMAKFLRPHDVMVTLGAGDVTKLSGEVLAHWKLTPPQKLKVAMICGGCSVEHEVALNSADNLSKGFDKNCYDVQEFGINKQGNWLTGPNVVAQLRTLVNKQDSQSTHSKIPGTILDQLQQCDLLFPILHGPYGEDGTIQGLFELLGMAYVGCDYRAAAVVMDKVLTKKLMIVEGIPTADFVSFNQTEWIQKPTFIKKQILEKLKFPIFVKPSHLGSSIGVKRVDHENELDDAIINALKLDITAMAETGIKGREIEFAVIGTDEITVLPPGEILTEGRMQSYDSKYNKDGFRVAGHANLPPEIEKAGMELAKRAYIAAGCSGFSRIDFFLDESGKFWINEINPIPGCTETSMFPQICEANKLSISELDDRLIRLALQRKRQQDRLKKAL
jgi:UDP-N-acetylmuramate--alanine ligase